jgi:hypothetical protein
MDNETDIFESILNIWQNYESKKSKINTYIIMHPYDYEKYVLKHGSFLLKLKIIIKIFLHKLIKKI